MFIWCAALKLLEWISWLKSWKHFFCLIIFNFKYIFEIYNLVIACLNPSDSWRLNTHYTKDQLHACRKCLNTVAFFFLWCSQKNFKTLKIKRILCSFPAVSRGKGALPFLHFIFFFHFILFFNQVCTQICKYFQSVLYSLCSIYNWMLEQNKCLS